MDLARTPAQLRGQFPYMFEVPNIGLAFYKGWFHLFAVACLEIDKILAAANDAKRAHGFHWTQVKEKLGSGRFYYELQDKLVDSSGAVSTLAAVDKIVENLEGMTERACIVCGEPAQVERYGPMLACVCSAHRRLAQEDRPRLFLVAHDWD